MLTVDALVAGYSAPVVGPIDLKVSAGEVVGFVGPNGSGKTTVLNAIVGLAHVFSGRIVRQEGIRVAVQQQRPVRLAEMPLTGLEYLALTSAHRQPTPDALVPLLPLRLDRLSGGQFQLLHVWACLGSPADLILLDEPTNNMDTQAITALKDLFLKSRERGAGVVVISHVRDLIDAVSTRVVSIGS
ncbi:MAG TPA: ATP-binding cassette domain-containing protein [Vicinamibacterales bacterium]